MAHRRLILGLLLASACAALGAERPSLDDALRDLKIPPPWLDEAPLDFDMSLPWNKAWDRIEQLIGTANIADRRKAIKLAYLYQKAGRAKAGYPASVYFLTGQVAWALVEHRKLATSNNAAHMRAASCYVHFGEHDKALAELAKAKQSLPAPPWRVFQEARVLEAVGGVYADRGDSARAQDHYRQAMARFRLARLPARQKHLVPRALRNVEARLDLLGRAALRTARLRDGAYTGAGYGHSGDVRAHVTVRAGRIADVRLDHREKADLGAKRILPQRILERQSIEVDGITGATTTSNAILTAAYRALKQAARAK
ncbi:FMN-binding protein [bacterium]|nr:FMN-binding protein [bacterium]